MLLDLNADLGEGAGTDAALMPLLTSASISCGLHAGNADTIAAALELAKRYGVSVGAHPGYADREHFGRREMNIPGQDLYTLFLRQLQHLSGLTREHGVTVGYVKAHGALYNQSVRERTVAEVLTLASRTFNPSLAILGLPNSELQRAAEVIGLPFIPEGFADRRYRPDGSLVPRSEPDALLHDPKEVAEQVEWLVRTQGVRTICVHGDTPGAVEFVATVRGFLLDRGHELKPFA